MRIVWQPVTRSTNEILGVKGLRWLLTLYGEVNSHLIFPVVDLIYKFVENPRKGTMASKTSIFRPEL